MKTPTNPLFAEKYAALQDENSRLRRKLARQTAIRQDGKTEELPDSAVLIETEPLPDLHDKLPTTLANALDHFEDQFERDVFLTAAIPVLAGLMPHVRGYYGGGHFSPDLYTAVAMPTAAGKSECLWARYFGHEVDAYLHQQSEQKLKDWKWTNRTRLDQWRDHSPCPSIISLFIPGNTSARALLEALKARGNHAIIFHTEADTYYKSLKYDAGTYHNALQLAFHHEPISYMRRGHETFIPRPQLSLFLSATPVGLSRLIPSSSDPLFSRFLFYYSEGAPDWKSRHPTFQSTRKEIFFSEAGRRLFSLYEQLINRSNLLWFELNSDQWTLHDRFYRAETISLSRRGYAYLDSTLKRNAFIAWRICMILSILRHFDTGTDLKAAPSITATDTDFNCALRLALAYLKHSGTLAGLVNHHPDTPEDLYENRLQALHRALPHIFTTAKATEIGATLGIPPRSTRAYLKCLRGGHLILRTGHGQYQNPSA